MVKSCCVKYCKSESYAGCGISFHNFPKDEDRKKKWLDIVPSSQKITKDSVVCSNHFKKEDFHEACSRKLLKEHVIPSIFPLDSGANAGCTSGDCDGEEQEDPSSSSLEDVPEAGEDIDKYLNDDDKLDQANLADEELSVFREQWQRELESPASQQDESKTAEEESANEDEGLSEATNVRRGSIDNEEELATFRQQWRRELEGTPASQPDLDAKEEEVEPTTDEERAKRFFLRGAALERGGKWYEAIQHYKRAMAIVPDIERRLYETTKGSETPQEEAEVVEQPPRNTTTEDDDEEEVVAGEEVVARLLRIRARRGLVIAPELPVRGGHISMLPYEVLLGVLRWVTSSELDAASLERAGATCRALHVAARDPDLWRALCSRTWGLECGTPRAHGFPSWRGMFVARPRLQLHGVYISKTTYLRHGEANFQDHLYRPWFLIDYYRYLRFFPEGLVLMWTTAEEPAVCVQQLRTRRSKPGLGILVGHYRLIGDKVVIVLKKTSGSEKKQSQASNTRFRARRKDAEQEQTQTFHLELQLRSVRGRRNALLSWAGYRVHTRSTWTSFELTARNFPPFAFSRVRSYALDARAPL